MQPKHNSMHDDWYKKTQKQTSMAHLKQGKQNGGVTKGAHRS